MSNVATPFKFKSITLNSTASTGITFTYPGSLIKAHAQYWDGHLGYRTVIECHPFKFNIASDAALAIGQKLFTFPEGLIEPKFGLIEMTSTCATGLSATAGEVGLGTVLATGANATLGSTAGDEDLMGGQTIANHVAATLLTTTEHNYPIGFGTTIDETPPVEHILDGTATAKSCMFNIASTWNQTAAEDVTINTLKVTLDWNYRGDV
jgi:hypothetical protein